MVQDLARKVAMMKSSSNNLQSTLDPAIAATVTNIENTKRSQQK